MKFTLVNDYLAAGAFKFLPELELVIERETFSFKMVRLGFCMHSLVVEKE